MMMKHALHLGLAMLLVASSYAAKENDQVHLEHQARELITDLQASMPDGENADFIGHQQLIAVIQQYQRYAEDALAEAVLELKEKIIREHSEKCNKLGLPAQKATLAKAAGLYVRLKSDPDLQKQFNTIYYQKLSNKLGSAYVGHAHTHRSRSVLEIIFGRS